MKTHEKINMNLQRFQEIVNSSPVPVSITYILEKLEMTHSNFGHLVSTQSKPYGLTKVKKGYKYDEILFTNVDWEQTKKVKRQKVKIKLVLTKNLIEQIKAIETVINNSEKALSSQTIERKAGLSEIQTRNIFSKIFQSGGLVHYQQHNKISKFCVNWENISQKPEVIPVGRKSRAIKEVEKAERTARQKARDEANAVLNDKAIKLRIYLGVATHCDYRKTNEAKEILKKEPQ